MLELADIVSEPVLSSLVYYAMVCGICELSRTVADRMFQPGSAGLRFAYEFLGVLQVCTCVFENGLVMKYYGLGGFWTVVFLLLFVHKRLNRGAFVNPAASTEAVVFARLSLRNYLPILLAQLSGGYMAFRLARQLWWFGMTNDHSDRYLSYFCSITHKVPIIAAGVYEVAGCFAIRLAVGVTSPDYKKYTGAFATASLLTIALYVIGVPGLNPIITTSRLLGCPGVDLFTFLILYWLCPVAGWTLAAMALDRKSVVSKKSD